MTSVKPDTPKAWSSRSDGRDAEGVARVGNGTGYPLASRLGGLWERRSISQRGSGQSPGEKKDFTAC